MLSELCLDYGDDDDDDGGDGDDDGDDDGGDDGDGDDDGGGVHHQPHDCHDQGPPGEEEGT